MAAIIMALQLEFWREQSHGNVYHFHKPLPDGRRAELRTKHFGGWAWSTALHQLQERGFEWQEFLAS
jgi:hypothetical protein